MCLDNTPDNAMFVREPLHARMRGIHLCVTRNVKDVVHCLGGIRVLFPLFAQLDQPLLPMPCSDIIYAADPANCCQLLGLLHDMLQGSANNLEAMRRSNGFAVIGYLLHQISPKHLSRQAIPILGRLMGAAASATNYSLDTSLLLDILKHFLLDFRLWVYTTPDVQADLLSLITEQVSKNVTVRPSSSATTHND